MTPEQQAILDKLQKVLDPKTFGEIKAVLIGLWTGAFVAAGYAKFVARLLLEWAAKQGGGWHSPRAAPLASGQADRGPLARQQERREDATVALWSPRREG